MYVPEDSPLPGPGHYSLKETLTKLHYPSTTILAPPNYAPDSRTLYPAANNYDVPRWPKQPFDQNPHAGDSERYTDEHAHALPGGIYEPQHVLDLPGPGTYDPQQQIHTQRPAVVSVKLNPHARLWPTLSESQKEINNVPHNTLPSTLNTQPSVKFTGKPTALWKLDSRLSYPAPHDRAPRRWPLNALDTISNGFHRSEAMPPVYIPAHHAEGGIYDPEWKRAMPGPGHDNPDYDAVRPSLKMGGQMDPLTLKNGWRTAPIPLWKQEVNNVGHVLLPSSLNTQPAVKICSKPTPVPDSRTKYPAPDKYDVMRWPKQPYDQNPHDDVAVAENFTVASAQKALEDVLRPEFPLEYARKEHINPAAANYHIKEDLVRPSVTKGGTMVPHDTWRTAPIPLWKQEVNNVGHVLLPSSLNTQPAVKICAKPLPPQDSRTTYPAPDKYDVKRFPHTHFDPYQESSGVPGARHTTSRGRVISNRPRSRPSNRYPHAQLRPVDVPQGMKRGFSNQLKQWFWYDPSGQLPLRLAPEDSSRWLAKRSVGETLKQAEVHLTKGSRSPKPSHLYAEDGAKATRGVCRQSQPWKKGRKHQVLSQGALNKDWSSPFLNLNTHQTTKSGMKIPRQSTMTLPLSSLLHQKKDLLSWVKKTRGPNVRGKGAPIVHGMYVKSKRPYRATSEEIKHSVSARIYGMNERLEKSALWEMEMSTGVAKRNGGSDGGDEGRTAGQDNTVAVVNDVVATEKDAGVVKPANTQVFYRMHNGKIVRAKVVERDENFFTLQLGQRLMRHCRKSDVFGTAPLCGCGRHGGHTGKCYALPTYDEGT